MALENVDPSARRTHAGHRVPLAWARLLSAHAAITRELNARMLSGHGLNLNAYEVLLFLSWAPEGKLRRSDLAASVLLTQGGITRLLRGLEADGLVASTPSAADRRVVYARLTPRGRRRLDRAAADHAADVDRLFTRQFSTGDLQTLEHLLAKLPSPRAVQRKAHRPEVAQDRQSPPR